MVEVRLHGALAQSFGKVWHLDIRTPHEAVAAIEANMRGFRKKIADLSRNGMVFRVRSKHHDYDNDDVMTELGSIKRIDFIPIVAGASAGVRFVAGAVLTVIGVWTANPYLTSMGVSLMLGSVVEWLTPKNKKEDMKNLQSWTLSGPANTVDQGSPVAVIFGEVLTGSIPVSAGISASQLSPSGSAAASVAIGGDLNPIDRPGSAGFFTCVLMLSAGVFNMQEPYAYGWIYTGFPNALAVRITNSDKATVRIEVDLPYVAAQEVLTSAGQVSVDVVGHVADEEVVLTAGESVSVTVDASFYDQGGGE